MSAPSPITPSWRDDAAAQQARDACFSGDAPQCTEAARGNLQHQIAEQSARLNALLNLWKHDHQCGVDFAPAYPTAAQLYLQAEPAA